MNPRTYIVTFDVASQDHKNRLMTAIKAYGTFAKITDHTWAITTNGTASTVRDHLNQFIATTDRLFVIKSGYESAWLNVFCTPDWLKKNL